MGWKIRVRGLKNKWCCVSVDVRVRASRCQGVEPGVLLDRFHPPTLLPTVTNHSIYTDRVLHDNTMWTRFQVFIRTSHTTTDIYNYLHLETILLSIRGTRKSSYPYYTGCLVKSVTNFEDGFLTSKLRNMWIWRYRRLFSVR